MSDQKAASKTQPDFGMRLAYWLTVAMVLIGLINMTPGIPGYDDLAASITGMQGATSANSLLNGFTPASLR